MVFRPAGDTTVLVADATGTANRATIPDDASGQKARYLMVSTNDPAVVAFVKFGSSTVAAAVTDSIPVPMNGVPVVMCVQGFSHVTAIRGGGSDQNVYLTPVEPA